ncbi:MAG: MoxR family ATPase [Peptococcaceae bacterium]|jgi:MoxR-like ATPase|nr:MoxR family ATPase [Peptococcaceae bacterium]
METRQTNDNLQRFEGAQDYIASKELKSAVNASITLGRPILIKGEPGTGKTMLAKSIADSLGLSLIVWSIKSTTKAKEGLYVYDTVQRLYDSQFGEEGVSDIARYIHLGKLGEAFSSEEPAVLLIDEIDKADIEFPNDLLWELDMMSFYIPETRVTVTAQSVPVVVITSNAEKELPDAFLRRCVFHYIEFPDQAMMDEIIHVHYPDLDERLARSAIRAFYKLRDVKGIMKKPGTGELLDWIKVLRKEDVPLDSIEREIPLMGVLMKKNEDIDYVRKQFKER